MRPTPKEKSRAMTHRTERYCAWFSVVKAIRTLTLDDARMHPKSPLFASLLLSHTMELTVPPEILRRFFFATQQILFCNLFRLFWKLLSFFSSASEFRGFDSGFSHSVHIFTPEFPFHNALQHFPIVFSGYFFLFLLTPASCCCCRDSLGWWQMGEPVDGRTPGRVIKLASHSPKARFPKSWSPFWCCCDKLFALDGCEWVILNFLAVFHFFLVAISIPLVEATLMRTLDASNLLFSPNLPDLFW